jgi:hypothetical protein
MCLWISHCAAFRGIFRGIQEGGLYVLQQIVKANTLTITNGATAEDTIHIEESCDPMSKHAATTQYCPYS